MRLAVGIMCTLHRHDHGALHNLNLGVAKGDTGLDQRVSTTSLHQSSLQAHLAQHTDRDWPVVQTLIHLNGQGTAPFGAHCT